MGIKFLACIRRVRGGFITVAEVAKLQESAEFLRIQLQVLGFETASGGIPVEAIEISNSEEWGFSYFRFSAQIELLFSDPNSSRSESGRSRIMLHFSCDLCGRQLGEDRFVVKVEVYPAFDPEQFDDEDLEHDNLQEIAEMISEMEITGATYSSEFEMKKLRYDLCQICRGRYLKDPLGRNKLRQIGFSDN